MTVVVFEMTLETVGKGKSRPPFPLQAPVCFSPALASPPLLSPLPSGNSAFGVLLQRRASGSCLWVKICVEEWTLPPPGGWNHSAYLGGLAFDRSVRSQLDKRPFGQSAEFIWPWSLLVGGALESSVLAFSSLSSPPQLLSKYGTSVAT